MKLWKSPRKFVNKLLIKFKIPLAGQHRCAAIPRYVDSVPVHEWQGVLGATLEINFWLRMEKSVSNYISGVRNTEFIKAENSPFWNQHTCTFCISLLFFTKVNLKVPFCILNRSFRIWTLRNQQYCSPTSWWHSWRTPVQGGSLRSGATRKSGARTCSYSKAFLFRMYGIFSLAPHFSHFLY